MASRNDYLAEPNKLCLEHIVKTFSIVFSTYSSPFLLIQKSSIQALRLFLKSENSGSTHLWKFAAALFMLDSGRLACRNPLITIIQSLVQDSLAIANFQQPDTNSMDAKAELSRNSFRCWSVFSSFNLLNRYSNKI